MSCVLAPPFFPPTPSIRLQLNLPRFCACLVPAGCSAVGSGGVQEALDADEQPDMLDFSDAADGLARTASNVSFTSEMQHSRQPGTLY